MTSASGPSRHFACAKQSGRSRVKADVKGQARPASLVENDPTRTCALSPRSYNRLTPVLDFCFRRSRTESAEFVGAAMHQIVEWLQKLGLGQYAHRFAENDITFVILPDLTDQDLEKIGVASLGHRRQLLRAISELKGEAEPSTVAAAPIAPHDTAERRQVTVMFSDLVGSTALSARMDPE